jgi:hypothetical protein
MPGGAEKRTSLDLPVEVWQEAKIQAIKEGIDFKTLVCRALREYVDRAPERERQAKKGGRHAR